MCAHAGAPRHDRRRGGLRWTPRPPCRPCLAGARACNDALRAPPAGLAVAFVAPLAGVLLIVEQSAANLAEAVYWRALLAAAAAVLALNVLAAAYEEGPGFWDARCARARAPARPSCAAREASEGPGARRLLFTFAPSAAPALAAYRVRLWELPAFAAAGALLGAAAALCVAVNVNVVHAARQRWAPPAARFRRALGLQSRARCDRPRLSTNLRRTHHMRPAQGPRVQSLPSLPLPEGAHVTPERARRGRRLAEVVLLAAATAGLWLGLCYASPCAATPPPARQAALAPAAIPTSLLSFGEYSLYPQLWCPRGEYSVHGQARPPRARPAPLTHPGFDARARRAALLRADAADAAARDGRGRQQRGRRGGRRHAVRPARPGPVRARAGRCSHRAPRPASHARGVRARRYAIATTLMLTATYGAGAGPAARHDARCRRRARRRCAPPARRRLAGRRDADAAGGRGRRPARLPCGARGGARGRLCGRAGLAAGVWRGRSWRGLVRLPSLPGHCGADCRGGDGRLVARLAGCDCRLLCRAGSGQA